MGGTECLRVDLDRFTAYRGWERTFLVDMGGSGEGEVGRGVRASVDNSLKK